MALPGIARDPVAQLNFEHLTRRLHCELVGTSAHAHNSPGNWLKYDGFGVSLNEGNLWSSSAERVEIAVGGVYAISAGLQLDTNNVTAAGTRWMLALFRNGVPYRRFGILWKEAVMGNDAQLFGSVVGKFTPGDYLEIFVNQNSGLSTPTIGGTSTEVNYFHATLTR